MREWQFGTDLMIRGQGVGLRPLAASDLPTTLRWRNDPRVGPWFFDRGPIREEDHRNWYQHYLSQENDFVFIAQDESGLAIGQCAVYHVYGGMGEVGRMMIGEEQALRQGYATRMGWALLDFSRSFLRMTSAYLEVRRSNAPAIGLYRKLGFKETGVYPEKIKMWRDLG